MSKEYDDTANFNIVVQYRPWATEKELFFNSRIKDENLNINNKQIVDLYGKFFESLKNNAEYIIHSFKDIKIIFSNVDIKDTKFTKDNSDEKVIIRKAQIFSIRELEKDSNTKPLLEFVDYIVIDKDITKKFNKSSLTYFNNFSRKKYLRH